MGEAREIDKLTKSWFVYKRKIVRREHFLAFDWLVGNHAHPYVKIIRFAYILIKL